MNKFIAVAQYNLDHHLPVVKGSFVKLEEKNPGRLTRTRLKTGFEDSYSGAGFKKAEDFTKIFEANGFCLEFLYE